MSHFFDDAPQARRDQRRPGKTAKSFLAVMVAVLVLAGGGWFVADRVGSALFVSDYAAGSAQEPVIVVIPSGSTLTDVAGTLTQAGVVESEKAFVRAARADDRATGIQAGSYNLPTHIPAKEAVAALLDPASRVAERITLREGLTLTQQLDAIAEQSGLPRKDLEALAQNPSSLGLPAYAKGLEGYLFPETYAFGADPTAQQILTAMVDQFEAVAAEIGLEQAAASMGRSPADLVTIASIVEAETRLPEDRPKVARVVENRLDRGMMLQMDSTVKYLAGKDGKVTTSDQERASDDPYNTYKYTGLPPGPIGAPGRAALDAAAHRADGPWLYFVTVDLNSGETKFASSFEEHGRYVAEFQAWCGKNPGVC